MEEIRSPWNFATQLGSENRIAKHVLFLKKIPIFLNMLTAPLFEALSCGGAVVVIAAAATGVLCDRIVNRLGCCEEITLHLWETFS